MSVRTAPAPWRRPTRRSGTNQRRQMRQGRFVSIRRMLASSVGTQGGPFLASDVGSILVSAEAPHLVAFSRAGRDLCDEVSVYHPAKDRPRGLRLQSRLSSAEFDFLVGTGASLGYRRPADQAEAQASSKTPTHLLSEIRPCWNCRTRRDRLFGRTQPEIPDKLKVQYNFIW